MPKERERWSTRLGNFANPIDLRNRVRARRTDIERQVQATRAQFEATNEKIVAKAGRNLVGAIVIALTLGSVMVVSLVVIKQLFMVFAGVVIAFTAIELAEALRHAGRTVPKIPTFIAGLAVVPTAYYYNAEGIWLVTLFGILAVTAWRLAAEIFAAERRSRIASTTLSEHPPVFSFRCMWSSWRVFRSSWLRSPTGSGGPSLVWRWSCSSTRELTRAVCCLVSGQWFRRLVPRRRGKDSRARQFLASWAAFRLRSSCSTNRGGRASFSV